MLHLANAQSNIVAGGGDASGSTGSVSYSIGQIDFQYRSSADYSVSEGVQQTYSFKAIQEQQAMIEEQQVYIDEQMEYIQEQQKQIESLIKEMNAMKSMLRDIQ